MSTAYTSPIDDILFTLRHVAGLDFVPAQGSSEGLDADLLHALLEGAGRFAETILAPANQAADREGARFEAGAVTTPADFAAIYRDWTAAGWNRISAPAEHGGAGLPLMINTAVMEMTTSAAMAFAVAPVLTHCAIDALIAHGDAALQATYLPRLVSGAWTATMNLTESQAGSDLAQIRTRAQPVADGTYRLTGTKIFITYGEHDWTENIIHLVLARLPDAPAGTKGLSLFLVPKFLPDGHGRPGVRNDVRCVGIEQKLGIHGSPTCSMSYGDDGGAVGWLVGAPHQGLACMFTMMNRARVATALQGVAIAERAFQQARLFAAERRQGRAEGASPTEISPIIAHPDIQMMLLTMRSLTAAARAVVYVTAAAVDRAERGGEPAAQDRADLLTPIAKAFASEIGVQVASLGIQVHGGTGYVEATGAAQHLRDARITPIYEGTNGIQAIDLVMRKLPRAGGAAVRTLLDEFRKTIPAGLAHPALRRASQGLAQALADLGRATEWLLAPERSPTEKLAGAGPYLQLFGLVAGTALILGGLLSAGDDDTRWRPMTGLLVFLADHLLADSGGRATAICGAAAALSEALAGLELSRR
jgi:butyryl-CoA dehydrogenase